MPRIAQRSTGGGRCCDLPTFAILVRYQLLVIAPRNGPPRFVRRPNDTAVNPDPHLPLRCRKTQKPCDLPPRFCSPKNLRCWPKPIRTRVHPAEACRLRRCAPFTGPTTDRAIPFRPRNPSEERSASGLTRRHVRGGPVSETSSALTCAGTSKMIRPNSEWRSIRRHLHSPCASAEC